MNESSVFIVFVKFFICLWLFCLFFIIIICVGLVMFVVGIILFLIYGDVSGYLIFLIFVGGFLLSFGVLLVIGI